MNAPINILPDTVKRLVELLDFEAAIAMVKRWGGLQLSPPKKELEELIGKEKAKLFYDHYGADEIYIATCAAALRNARYLEVIEDLASMTVAQVARKYKMTERNVQYIGKKSPESLAGYNPFDIVRDERQMDLF
ncbi:Mor transcription activator family protein [Azonexus sp. R2A61]|uniref:Mor transcription activator family protein n=1 Tax=Azonexus sp. R2A61 TaxID=2744443 RepID=UPI001F22401B|nr:Mor transcription activator family protein [Azonexus sp. R2A61]